MVDRERKAGPDPRDRRQDAETEGGAVEIEIADRLDEVSGQPDLLLGLAQCRIERRGVGRVDLAAGKGDLAARGR
ncbi:hypothetical protein ACVI3S_006296 [Bradyrhizobium diazoefficiens]